MNSWVWERYYENLKASNASLEELLQDKAFCRKVLNNKNISYQAHKYYGKTPHSRQFKFDTTQTTELLTKQDNSIATINEYLLLKKYKDLEFLTANHHILNIHNLQLPFDERYGLICEDLLDEEFEYITLDNFFNSKHKFTILSNNIDIKSENISTVKTFQKHKTFPYFFRNFNDLIKYKNKYLNYITSHCYDQIIKNILSSIFEFGDDEHTQNAILCRKKGNEKFEELLLFDKESSSFIINILQNNNLEVVKKYYTNEFNKYNYFGIHICDHNESFKFKCHKLYEFIQSGIIDKKYWKYLEILANYDYDKTAQIIEEETGITPIQRHIDMLKYGSECAGKLYEMSK